MSISQLIQQDKTVLFKVVVSGRKKLKKKKLSTVSFNTFLIEY